MTESGINVTADQGSEITTDLFRISSARFIKFLLGKKAFWFFFASGLFFLISVVFGIFVDIRIIILALMIIFILIPFVVFIFYFYYALTPLNSSNILPHTLKFSSEGISIDIDAKTDDAEEHRMIRRVIPVNRIRKYSIISDGLAFPVDEGRDFIMLPYRSLSSPDELKRVLELIYGDPARDKNPAA